jgi:formylglycine-generating enzyme required for sulfatase activity
MNKLRLFSMTVLGGWAVGGGICCLPFQPNEGWQSAASLERPPNAVVPSPSAQPHEIINSIGMKLVLIPAGEFMMGSPQEEKDRSNVEGPQHRVRITKPFYLGIHEVTVGQFRRFVTDASYKTEAGQEGKGGYGYDRPFWVRKPE